MATTKPHKTVYFYDYGNIDYLSEEDYFRDKAWKYHCSTIHNEDLTCYDLVINRNTDEWRFTKINNI